MMGLLGRLPLFAAFRGAGWPALMPLNLTVSVTYRCNARCRTCNIHRKKSAELSLSEWRRIFKSLGRSVYWVTISGGEPFLRSDLARLVCSLYDLCRPAIINIPTNGYFSARIESAVREIAAYCRKAQLVVNLSLDDIADRHDAIRGLAGSYRRAIATFGRLKSLELSNLTVGIHTVVSKFNVKRLPQIHGQMQSFDPDSYVTEIAEQRQELDTVSADIAPAYEDYARAVDYLIGSLRSGRFNRIGRIAGALRIEYYRLVKRTLSRRRQAIPCYAGIASAHIAPNGDLWFCCTKADPVGNLKEARFDFKRIWLSQKAKLLRDGIRKQRCFCPLANAAYTNMLHHPVTLLRAAWNLLRME